MLWFLPGLGLHLTETSVTHKHTAGRHFNTQGAELGRPLKVEIKGGWRSKGGPRGVVGSSPRSAGDASLLIIALCDITRAETWTNIAKVIFALNGTFETNRV